MPESSLGRNTYFTTETPYVPPSQNRARGDGRALQNADLGERAEWWAAISLIFGTLGAIYFLIESEGLGAAISLVVGYGQAVIYWGLAELVVFLARTAHNTDRAAAALERREAKERAAERKVPRFHGAPGAGGGGIAEDPWAGDGERKSE